MASLMCKMVLVVIIIFQLLPLPTALFLRDGRITHFHKRQVTLRISLPPGTYAIIPNTYEPDQEGQFLVRLFLNQGWVRGASPGTFEHA